MVLTLVAAAAVFVAFLVVCLAGRLLRWRGRGYHHADDDEHSQNCVRAHRAAAGLEHVAEGGPGGDNIGPSIDQAVADPGAARL